MHNYHIGGEFLSLGLFGIREITFTYFVKLKQKQNLWIFLFSEILPLLSILRFSTIFNDFDDFAYFYNIMDSREYLLSTIFGESLV